MKLSILNSREKKTIMHTLKRQYGFEDDLHYVFLRSSKDKLYIINDAIKHVNLDALRIDKIGLYFGTVEGENIRLSIEGSEIIGPHAKKHVLVLDEHKAAQWMAGEDVPIEGEDGWYIITDGTDFLGCGKIRENTLYNFVPKERRV